MPESDAGFALLFAAMFALAGLFFWGRAAITGKLPDAVRATALWAIAATIREVVAYVTA